MTFPAVTTLSSLVTLAHQQYGIRFQLTSEQLVAFANTCQMVAYNQDLSAFEEWNQTLFLGQDIFGTYNGLGQSAPAVEALGQTVTGSVSGVIGTLMNFKTQNRLTQWIVEPVDNAGVFTLADGETLSLGGGYPSTLLVASGQNYPISNGPYLVPRVSLGNPPFRKYIGITRVTDKQIYGVPHNDSETDPFDYGLDLNYYPARKVNTPARWNETDKTVKLITNGNLEITQNPITTSGVPTNDSAYRWVYYVNPPSITNISQEANLIIPEEYRYEIIYKGIEMLADTATYGAGGTVRELLARNCERFWEDKGVQFQAYGKANDWISHGDTWGNDQGRGGNYHHHGLGNHGY